MNQVKNKHVTFNNTQHFQNIDAADFDDAVAGLDIDDLLEAEAVDPDIEIEEDLTDYFDIRVKRRMASKIWQALSKPKKNLWLQRATNLNARPVYGRPK